MDSYPSNSHKSKNNEPAEEPTKRVERVVESQVLRRKKPLGKRFIETFFGGEARNVGPYVFFEVILPAMKDTIADVTSQSVERMLWGESRSTSRRSGNRSGYGNSYVSYNRFSPNSRDGGRRDEPRGPSRRARATHDFDEIILATRAEATEVIDRLFDLVSRYEAATVADLYEMVGVEGNYTDDKWGWTDVRGAGVTRIRNGYLLDLPRPEPLD